VTTDPKALVERAWDELDITGAMRDLARLTRFDRYQASDGISAAARFVADRAGAAGLAGVEIRRIPADGRRLFGTYEAPQPWTPRTATLSVSGGTCAVAYPADPLSLALHSVSTPDGGVTAPLVPADSGSLSGAVVLLAAYPSPPVLARLVAGGAIGFAAAVRPDTGAAGRIELPAGTPLFGFSLTADQYAHLSRAASAGRDVVARVVVDTAPATMPVVTAYIPGTSRAPEILVTAHLCHPAPSAGDNASGVAAALAAGEWLARQHLYQPVRFVWGPEFAGLAAYAAAMRRPSIRAGIEFAVNLDMVGQDPAICGGPLTVERTPGHAPHPVDAVVDYCLRTLPAQQRSYSGAVGCDNWTYRSTPFVGASDHAILADRAVGVPAVQIGHWPDRYNHSSADTIDKIDPQELRRAATVVAATVAAFAVTADRAAITAIAARHAVAELAACLPDPGAPPSSPAGWIDPGAADQRAYRIQRCVQRSAGSAYHEMVVAVAAQIGTGAEPDHDGPVLKRTWPGPFNLRGLLAAAPPEHRGALEALLAERGRGYALIMALAQAIDGATPWSQVVVRAAHEAELPMEHAFADTVREALLAAGWVA